VKNVIEVQRLLGESWTGVKFYFSGAEVPDIRKGNGLRFCEAVVQSRSGPLVLLPGDLTCPGAGYVFGWDRAARPRIVAEVAGRRNLGRETADRIVSEIPVMDEPPTAIGLNAEEIPDLIVSYCQPTTAMDFLKLWQAEAGGRNLMTGLSSVLSV
jgi:uncharacterized protein (DUF169 family)